MCRFQEQCWNYMCQYKHNNEQNEQNGNVVKTDAEILYWCTKCKRKFTTKVDLNNHRQFHDKDKKSDDSTRSDYVSQLLAEPNCENCLVDKNHQITFLYA